MKSQNKYQKRYDHIMQDIEKTKQEAKKEDQKLVKIWNDSRYRIVNPQKEMREHYTFGDKVADKVASFGGSWTFIISFIVVLILWMGSNVIGLFHFDPYPFILCNLFLSCIAAVQAPIIMMSDNRQAQRDKVDAENDAKVNRQTRAELNLLMRKSDNLERKLEQLSKLQSLELDIKLEKEVDK